MSKKMITDYKNGKMSESKLHLILSTVKAIKAKLDQEESDEQERIERMEEVTNKVKQAVKIVNSLGTKEDLIQMIREAILGSEETVEKDVAYSTTIPDEEFFTKDVEEMSEEESTIEELLDSIINHEWTDISVEDIRQTINEALCSDNICEKLTVNAIGKKVSEIECEHELKRVKLFEEER